jgi:NAD(P)H-hydrate epimerase
LEPDTTLISSGQMYRIENNGEAVFEMKKVLMMENAGHGLADYILSEMKYSLGKKEIVSFCGTGNNGGDAMVASRHLSGYYGANVTVIILGEITDIKTEEARTNFNIIKRMKSIRLFYGDKALEKAGEQISKGNIIIDGIFGTGIKGNIRDPHSSAIEIINSSNGYIVSVDIPSGLDPDTGATHDKCVRANSTVTFHRIKKGLVGKQDYTGKIFLERIGIPIEAEEGVL